MRCRFLGVALAAGLAVSVAPANAADTLTTSYANWLAAVGAANVTNTVNTGLGNPFALFLPTTSTIPLNDGQTLGLSNIAQVTQPQNGYPYAFSDGFIGDVLIPTDGNGNQVSTETIIPTSDSLSAFGFEIVPFSSDLSGPYNVTVKLANGASQTVSEAGGDFNSGTVTPAFFGYYGSPISSLTITSSDPNGLAFGNFVDVPEPGSLVLLLTGLLGLTCLVRRTRC